MFSFQRWIVTQATKVFFSRRKRPVDRAALVHLAVDVFEELRPQVVAEVRLFIDRMAPCSRPDGVERFGRVMAEAVARSFVSSGRRGRECRRGLSTRGRPRGVEDAFAVRAEAAEGDAESETQMVAVGAQGS